MWNRHKLLIIGIILFISGLAVMLCFLCILCFGYNMPLLIDPAVDNLNSPEALTEFGIISITIATLSFPFGFFLIMIGLFATNTNSAEDKILEVSKI